jgi:phosphatidylglycerophosphate synthase
VSARTSGKIKAIVQGIAIGVILGATCLSETLGISMDQVKDHSGKLMWFVAAVTLFSLVDYLVGNRKVLAALDR